MKTSVIIRTRNEGKTVGTVLDKLSEQTFRDFELILVDNESSDNTLKIAKKYKIDKFINIPEGKFSHPKSLNDAIKEAKGDLIVILNGHSAPITRTWLEDGIRNFNDPKVAGITGDYTFEDEKPSLIDKIRLPITGLSNTNSIIRKDLWKKYHFDEALTGSEDYDWGLEMMSRGYKVIKDPRFMVRHYHKITPEIRRYWAETLKIIEAKKRNKPLIHKIIYQFRKIRYT